MTIKARNRLTFIFSIVSFVIFLVLLFITLYQVFAKKLSLPIVYTEQISKAKLLTYNPACVIINIFIELFFVSLTSYIIFRSFEKTQAPDMLFFLLFLFACLCDGSRILVPLLGISDTLSLLSIRVGSISLLARFLAPLSLFGATVLSTEDFKQNTESNTLILLIVAMFFSYLVPINTTAIKPNFCISYAYVKIIKTFSVILCLISAFCVFIQALKNEYKANIVIGFMILCSGYMVTFGSYSILSTILSPLLLGFGSAIYLSEIHKHYLWID